MVELLNKTVMHKSFGLGTVVAQDEKHITVEFSGKTSKFVYPSAFEKFLVPVENDVKEAVNAEIDAIKAAEVAAKAAEAAKRAADEQDNKDNKLMSDSHRGRKTGETKAYVSTKRTPGQQMTYLVFQGNTFDEECKGQFIWAPQYTTSGGTCHHWDRLMEVREGDVIFNCSGGYIKAISKAKGPCEDCQRPDNGTSNVDWTQWGREGRKVSCEYHQLANPLKHGSYKDTILKYCKVKYAPFDRDGNGNMGYLYDLNKELATFFLAEIIKNNPEISGLEFLGFLFM